MPNLEYLYLSYCGNLEEVSPSLGCCRKLIRLHLTRCSKLKRLPEKLGDLENLEELHASDTAISQPPSSIARLTKLTYLTFSKSHLSKVHFVFPPVGEGLRSLEFLKLTNCNLIDGGLPEDIGCLSSLKKLYLRGNDFEHLPRSIGQLGALQVLDLGRCKRLNKLPELPPELVELNAEWEKDCIYNSFAHALFQNLSSKQHDISASDSLSQRMFTIEYKVGTVKIPSWFHYQGRDITVSANLPKDWYSHDNFLGFAVCYDDILVETTVHLVPLCDDGEMSWMTQKLALHNYSKHDTVICGHWFIFSMYLLLAYGIHLRKMGKHQMTMGILRYSFLEKIRCMDFVCCMKMSLRVNAMTPRPMKPVAPSVIF